eukprot:gene12525-13708_t
MSRNTKPKNPFEDILSSTINQGELLPQREDLDSISQINGSEQNNLFSISSEAEEQPANLSSTKKTSKTAVIKSIRLESEVNDLLRRLKTLVGDFDTTEIRTKMEEKTNKNRSDSKIGGSSPTLKRKGSNFPTMIRQKQPFRSSHSLHRLSALSNASRDANCNEPALKLASNRYSVGFNIFSQKKYMAADFAGIGMQRIYSPQTVKDQEPAEHETLTEIPSLKSNDHLDDRSSILPEKESFAVYNDREVEVTSPMPFTPPRNQDENLSLPSEKRSKVNGFMEFSMLTVDHGFMSGKKRLLRSNLQPATMTHRFPHDQPAVVDNLHEYIFPYGCAMQTLRLKDWRRLKKTKQFEPKYQIMQFTDASHHIYHAYVIIVHERVSDVCNPHIIRQLEELHTMTLASNTIKRWIRAYMNRILKSNSVRFQAKDTLSNDEASMFGDEVQTSNKNSHKKFGKSTNSLKSFVKAIKHQFGGRQPTHVEKDRFTALTKKELSQNEKSLDSVNKKNTSTWSKFLKVGSKKSNKGTLSTRSSESSSSVISGQCLTDDGFSMKGTKNITTAAQDPTLVCLTPKRLERFSLDNAYLSQSPQRSPSNCEPLIRHKSNSLWATLETSAVERRRSSFSSPFPVSSPVHHGNLKPAKSNNFLPPRSPLGGGKDFSFASSNSSPNKSFIRKPLKQLKSMKFLSFQQNKKVIIRQKALCFLSEFPMPSIFFRILEALVKGSKTSSNKQRPSSQQQLLKKAHSQRLKSFVSHSTNDSSCYGDAMTLATASSESTMSFTTKLELLRSTSDLAMILDRPNSYDEDWFDSGPLSPSSSPVPFKLAQTLSRNNSVPLTLSPNASSESIKIPEPQLIEYLLHLQSLNWTEMCNSVTQAPIEIAPKLKASSQSTPGSAQGMIPPVHIPANPVTVEQWAVSILVSLIPVEVIVHIHSLLLMEKSLLVLGSEASVVSLLTTAFIHLLKPFKWAGVFVPILPPLAQEILDAPVPFIVGIVDHRYFTSKGTHRPGVQISPSASVLYVDDFIRYPNEYQHTHGELNNLADSNIQTASNDSAQSIVYAVPIPTPRSGKPNPFDDLSGEESYSSTTINSKIPSLTLRDYFQRSNSNASSIDAGNLALLRFFEPCKLDGDKISSSRSDSSVHSNVEGRSSGIQTTQQLLLHTSELTQSLLHLTKRYLHLYMFFNHYFHDHDPATYSMNYLIRKLLLDNHHITRHQRLYQVIKKILELFSSYNTSYCAEILRYEHSWQRIASIHPQHDEVLQLDVEKMLLPMKLSLAFQESVCRTQMFAGLVDQSYSTYLEHGRQRELIRDWLTYRILIRKQKQSSQKSLW